MSEDVKPYGVDISQGRHFNNDTLWCLFLHGPTWDGNVPSKRQRDDLWSAHLIERSRGYQWLTRSGVELCLALDYDRRKQKHRLEQAARRHDAATLDSVMQRLGVPQERPTIESLEALLRPESQEPIVVNPDGSIAREAP